MKSTKRRIVIALLATCATAAIFLVVRGYEIIPSSRLDRDLRSAISHNRGGTIDLSRITQLQWDHLAIFPPYSSVSNANGQADDVDEGHCVLQFTNRNQTVYILRFNRRYGDFATLGNNKGYSPEESVFAVEDGHNHWPKIKLVKHELPNQAL